MSRVRCRVRGVREDVPMHRRATEPALKGAGTTWNDAERIDEHRKLSPAERLRRTIEVSRATLRFTHGRRR